MGDSAADGHLLVDLERFTLDRKLPLARLSPDAAPLVPDPLPDTLLPEPARFRMVGEGIAPSTANPEPCVKVSLHTAPQCMVI